VGGTRRRLHLLVAAVLILALTLTCIATTIAMHQPVPSWWRICLACGVVAGSRLPVLRMRFRGNVLHFDWAEGGLLLGLVLLPPAWLILITPICAVAAGLALKKGTTRSLYNASAATIATAAAGWLATAVWQIDSGSLSWRLVAALCLAGFVFTAVVDLAASGAIALSQNQAFFRTLRVGLGLELLTGTGNVGAALVIVAVTGFDAWLLATVPMLLIALQLSYHSRLRGQQERETWTRLEQTTRAFTQLDPAAVAEAAIDGILELFQADWVEVLFRGPDGTDARYRGGLKVSEGDGARHDGGPAVTVPLGQPEAGLGWITLHFAETVALNRRERHALATLATALAVALANADRYEATRGFAEAKAREALTDPVTGLGNRTRLTESGAEQLAKAAASGGYVAMMLVDLDHFKDVNDTLGHDTGDRLLAEVARRLTANMTEDDLVVRLGSHEFAILAETGNSRRPEQLCARLIATLDQPMILDGLNISTPASIGIACYPEDAHNTRDLLRLADTALVRAKSATGRYARYDAVQDQARADRLLILDECRAGLDNGEFLLHYQPKVDLDTCEIRGVEALIRWRHPIRGLLSPMVFMPAVEQSALVHEFTHRILDMAMADCGTWLDRDPRHTLAVNLSARNLLNLGLPDDVQELLKNHRMPARQLVLEVTETAMMSDLDTVDTVLTRLRDTGVRLSLDDFGTGYSSLSVLARIAVDEVKIDASFVARMLTSQRDDVVVRGTLSLAGGLGLGVVAEGVENAAQHKRLLALGCQTGQGYYYCPPVPIEELPLLSRHLQSTAGAVPPQRSSTSRGLADKVPGQRRAS